MQFLISTNLGCNLGIFLSANATNWPCEEWHLQGKWMDCGRKNIYPAPFMHAKKKTVLSIVLCKTNLSWTLTILGNNLFTPGSCDSPKGIISTSWFPTVPTYRRCPRNMLLIMVRKIMENTFKQFFRSESDNSDMNRKWQVLMSTEFAPPFLLLIIQSIQIYSIFNIWCKPSTFGTSYQIRLGEKKKKKKKGPLSSEKSLRIKGWTLAESSPSILDKSFEPLWLWPTVGQRPWASIKTNCCWFFVQADYNVEDAAAKHRQ